MANSMLFISIDPIEFRRRVLNQIESAKAEGYQVTVISTSPAQHIRDKYDFKYSEIYIPNILMRGVFRFPIFNLMLLFKILFKHYTVIHFRGIIPIPAILIRQFMNKSLLIYDAHEYFRGHQTMDERPIRKAIWLWFEKRITYHLEYLITVSEPLGDLLKTDYPNLKRIAIIRSVPVLKTNQDGYADNQKIQTNKCVLFHGYFHPGRALENIILAFSEMIDSDINLMLIGEGPLKNKLTQMVSKLRLESNIKFIDFIPNDELISYISRATIGLSIIQADCLNRKYALPNKFFEYIHAGLPVLASNIPTLQFYNEKYKVGKVVDPENPQAIAETISAMVTDQNQLDMWKENCRIASQELNWQEESKKLSKIYRNILS